MKKLILCLLILCIPAILVVAHDPYIEDTDWGSYDDPYIVIDATISYALFGYLNEDDTDAFEINYVEEEDSNRLAHGIVIPVCGEHYLDFYPHYAILAPEEYTDDSLEIPVELPEGYGVYYYEEPLIAGEDYEGERTTWVEEFTGKTYYREERPDLTYPAEGIYYVVVFSPDGQVGDYSLALGYEELFFNDRDETAEAIAAISSDSWLRRDCDLAPDDPDAIINLPPSEMAMGDMDSDDDMGGMDMSNMGSMADIPEDLDTNLTQMSDRFMTTLASDLQPIELNTLHSWTITVTDMDGNPVESASINFDGGMPVHGHGMPTVPQVTDYLGEGQYLVEGVRFQMPGWWQFTVEIEVNGETDASEFNIILP